MKRAFTLVELMVSVVIVLLISGGALVNLNRFNSRQKLEKGKDEVVAAIKMIQSSARSRQLPVNWNFDNGSELLYIKFYKPFTASRSDQRLIAQANEEEAVWYYLKSLKELEVDVSLSPLTILFGAGTGKLIKDLSTTPYTYFSDTETATVIVENEAEETEGYQIVINALGQIKEVNYYEEVDVD